MAKYATKGEPRSQSATEILSVCVNRLNDTDMASSALRRAMIQVVEERDIGSQETAHMLVGKPLYCSSLFFLCVSLDGSRRVRTGQDDDDNQGDKPLDPSVLDHYAIRANWQENIPQILNLNLVQFASAYYATKGELKRRKQEVVIRSFPNFSPNLSGKINFMESTASMVSLNISHGQEQSILYGMNLKTLMKITFSATMHFLPLKLLQIIFHCCNKN